MSCGGSYRMTVTSSTEVPPKPVTCDFRVLNLPPTGEDYEEVATLTPSGARSTSPETFKHAVHEDVCRVGGDAVVTEINGQGWYVRGTVLRKRAPAATPLVATPPSASPQPAPQTP